MSTVLADEDNVVRYVRLRLFDVEKGEVDGTAFVLDAAKGEQALSVNWLEYFGGAVEYQVTQVRAHIHQKMNATGVLAQLNVGASKSAAAAEPGGSDITFVGDGQPAKPPRYPNPDPSHALVRGLPPGGSSAAAAIGDRIRNSIVALHPTS